MKCFLYLLIFVLTSTTVHCQEQENSTAFQLIKEMSRWKFDCIKPHVAFPNLPLVIRLSDGINSRKDEE